MILGRLADVSAQRAALPAALVQAIEAVLALDPDNLPSGRHDIVGDRVFVLVQEATPRHVEDSLSEAHAIYADVQMPLGAAECFGFSLPQADLTPCDDQLAERDLAFYPTPDNEAFIDVAPGDFIVFLPGELHRPCIAIDGTAPFRKAVIKVHRDLLGLN